MNHPSHTWGAWHGVSLPGPGLAIDVDAPGGFICGSMPLAPSMTGNGNDTTYIFMVKLGIVLWLFYQHRKFIKHHQTSSNIIELNRWCSISQPFSNQQSSGQSRPDGLWGSLGSLTRCSRPNSWSPPGHCKRRQLTQICDVSGLPGSSPNTFEDLLAKDGKGVNPSRIQVQQGAICIILHGPAAILGFTK